MDAIHHLLLTTLVLLVVSVLQSTAKSFWKAGHNRIFQTYSCRCSVRVNTTSRGLLEHDFGEIRQFSEDPLATCHDVRHECRDACHDRASLNHPVEGGDPDGHHKLGYLFCSQYAMPTFDGPLLVEIQADVPECTQHKPIKLKHSRLCCGFTAISLGGADQKTVKALGWDMDCDSSTYVV